LAKGREKLWLARGEKACVAFWESPRREKRALWFFHREGRPTGFGSKNNKKRWGQRLLVDEFSLGFICVSSLFNSPPPNVACYL